MANRLTRTDDAAELRQQAEEMARKEAASLLVAMSPEDMRRALHELRVHQIELEMQNEALRSTQAELDASRSRYFSLYDLAPVGYVTLRENGLIQEANLTAAALLGVARSTLLSGPLSRFILKEDLDLYYLCRKQDSGTGRPQGCELRMLKSDGTQLWVQLAITTTPDVEGEPVSYVTLSDITERKRAEETLRESEAKYRMLFETVVQAVVYQSADGKIVAANHAAELLLGLSLDQMQGRTSMDSRWKSIHEDGSDFPGDAHPSMVALAAAKIVRNVVMGVFHPEEEDYRWINITAVPEFRPGEATPYQVCTTFDDITERKRAEGALERLRGILSEGQKIAHVGTFEYVTDTKTTVWSEEEYRIYGLDPAGPSPAYEVMLAKSIHPDDAAPLHQAFTAAIQSSSPYELEHRIVRPDGSVRWVHDRAIPYFDPDGKLIRYVGATLDITERKRLESVLVYLAQTSSGKAGEPFFGALARYLAQSLGMDFVCIDRLVGDGLTARTMAVWCDGKFEDNVTYALKDTPCGDVVGKAVCCFPASVCQFFPRDQVLLDLRAESYVGVTLWSHTGQPIGLIAVIGRRPMADRSLAETTLRLVAVRAAIEMERLDAEAAHEVLRAQFVQSQKLESVGRLAGGVAHDFNNLLMGIMNYVELCRDEVPPEHPVRGYLDEITRDAQRSADITKQLLAFARKQIIAPKVLDLNDALGGMLKMLRHLLGEDIAVNWMPGTHLWPVKIDPGQLDQILVNLCINARDAIAGVGEVVIETAKTTLDDAYCSTHAETIPGEYVRLAVSDCGCGMGKDVLAHIFEPFYTTKEVGKGTGLGLATVYGIVEQNHGHIEVQSEEGKGTTFGIYLPRATSEADAGPVVVTPERLPRGTETILLAEDEKSVRVTSRLFLEALGYTVLAAATPEEALSLAGAHNGPIHLLITDVIMPGMNGPDLAGILVAKHPKLKCMFMSGYTADVMLHRGTLKEGMQFLPKPFSRHDLARKVREVLDGD
jgi:PAS domain S-box-containing protein